VTKVLYVEDNDDNVFMLKMRLELLGDFEVLTAEDGEQGYTIALGPRNARGRRLGSHTKAQGRSANARHPNHRALRACACREREKALAAGCNEFDTKPIEFDRLVATLRRILANRK
jgi:two-component system, cell cycle response regulator DivK